MTADFFFRSTSSAVLAVVTACCIFGMPLAVHAQVNDNIYAARNSISSTGDNAISLILDRQSQAVIFIESNQSLTEYSRDSVLDWITENEGQLLTEALAAFPDLRVDTVELVALANFAFSRGQYSTAAAYMTQVLEIIPAGDPRRADLVSTARSSYYGSARHLEGLKFICDQYRGRPSWDFQHRHAIHAHLRSLAVNLGHQKAEDILNLVRRDPTCRRPDFSPVWIPIHLQDMRALERSVPPVGANYGLSSDEDIAFANTLLQRNDIGFLDYLLFVEGYFEQIVRDYPSSYVYDLALLGVGEFSDYQIAKDALNEYINGFERHQPLAASILFRRAFDEGDTATRERILNEFGANVFELQERFGGVNFQIGRYTRVWFRDQTIKELSFEQLALISEFYSDCGELVPRLIGGEFTDVREKLVVTRQRYHEIFAEPTYMEAWFGEGGELDYQSLCGLELQITYLEILIEFLDNIIDAQQQNDPQALFEIALDLKICGDKREAHSYLESSIAVPNGKLACGQLLEVWESQNDWPPSDVGKNESFSLHRLAATLFSDAYNMDPIGLSRAKFLEGLSYRNNEDYEDFARAMQEYVTFHASDDFADDALAELGWYELAVRSDYNAAQQYFERVVSEYASQNAYDNALNWLVILHRETGELSKAAYWSAKLLQTVTSRRLSQKTVSRDNVFLLIEELQSDSSEIIRVAEEPDPYSIFGTSVQIIIASRPASIAGIESGDFVSSVNGLNVETIVDFYSALLTAQRSGFVEVELQLYSWQSGQEYRFVVPLSSFGFS